MRLYFPSAHRADNVAQLFKKELKRLEIKRTDDAIREALAVACGYRNRNEMLKVLANNKIVTSADEDTPVSEVVSRSTSFVEKFAEALNVDRHQVRTVYEAVLPFSGRSFLPKITKSQIEWLAANLTRRAIEIKPLGTLHADPEAFAGFSLKLDDGHGYDLEVAGNGDLEDCDSQNLAVLLDKAGFFKIPERIDPQVGANLHILSTLRRLDAKALFALRHARLFSGNTYHIARSIPDNSPMMRALHTYPRLSPYFKSQVESREEVDLNDPSPLDSFAAEVRRLSMKKWPSLTATAERALEISRKYLSVKPGNDGCITLVAAFLMHMPDDTLPTTTEEYQKCEAFLFSHSDLFERNGFAVSPLSFAAVFKSHYGKDWEKARKRGHRGSLVASSLAATVIAQAAREIGYADATAGQFEEPEAEEFADAFYELGIALLQESNFSWIEAMERLERMEVLSNEHSERWDLALADKTDMARFYREDDKVQYKNYAELLLHPRHRGKSAGDILSERGFDLRGYIADSKDFGTDGYLLPTPTIVPPNTVSSVSGDDAGAAWFPVYISALWHDAVKKESGNTTILVKLRRPLDEIIPSKRYRYARTLGDFRRAASDRIYSEHWITSEFDPVAFVCKAARELQFMCATGLVPSKKYGGPGNIGGEFPEWDHGTSWIDPASGKTFFASEPYHAEVAESTCQDWAAANKSTFLLSSWPGMYEPPSSGLILIAEKGDAAMLAKMEEALALINVTAYPETIDFVDVPDGQVFFSPRERLERKGPGLVPPKKDPWKE